MHRGQPLQLCVSILHSCAQGLTCLAEGLSLAQAEPGQQVDSQNLCSAGGQPAESLVQLSRQRLDEQGIPA